MLLAGGQGSRLYALTRKNAKPAVPFGGKYRIIDFPLSNCINSGIDTVGVLTQYQPLILNDYIGNGLPWDLDRAFGGVKILPPYQKYNRAEWYKGTANAIYQNMEFIERYDPEYVLILSGDHIYKMDYTALIEYHKQKKADCTIAVLEVPLSEASRFGIMSTHEDNEIYQFTEKPKKPESTKASMGIYVFHREKLFDYLRADEADPESANDFGKNVIPAMLAAGERIYAYPFKGYWKDVGTIDSLWEANMDLLGDTPKLSLNDGRWRIFSRHETRPPQFVGKNAAVDDALVTDGCEIYGTVRHSVLGSGVKVMPGAVVCDSVLMNDVIVEAGAEVNNCIIDGRVLIGMGSRIGVERGKAKGITVAAADLNIPAGTVIGDREMITEIQ